MEFWTEVRRQVLVEGLSKRGACDRFDPPMVADPGQFVRTNDAVAFIEKLRNEAGWLRRRRVRMVPMSARPPLSHAFVTLTDTSDNELSIGVLYDIPRWKWRLNHFFLGDGET